MKFLFVIFVVRNQGQVIGGVHTPTIQRFRFDTSRFDIATDGRGLFPVVDPQHLTDLDVRIDSMRQYVHQRDIIRIVILTFAGGDRQTIGVK